MDRRAGLSAGRRVRGAEPPARRSAARAVRACLPGDGGRSLAFLGEGDFCTAWLLGGARVVRVPKHAEARAALEREARLLRALPPLPVPTPRPEHRSAGPDGPSLSVHDLVRGTPLEREAWLAFPDAARGRLARAVGAFLAALHDVDPAVGRACGLPDAGHRTGVRHLLGRLESGEGTMPRRLRGALGDALAGYLAGAPGAAAPAVVLHGDFGPSHVLLDEGAGTLSGVIDWGDARLGDPARDFIFVYEDWGTDFLRIALAGYGREEPGALLPRVRVHYLADQLAWTLEAEAAGRRDDVAHGVRALEDAVRDLPAAPGAG